MSGLTVTALVVASIWLALLTLVTVLVVRQIALITVRLDRVGSSPIAALPDDGPALGSRIPEPVANELPELDTGLAHLLLLSASCGPCRELAAELHGQTLPNGRAIVALVPGRKELADGLVDLLPPSFRAVRDPHATELASLLQLEHVPSALTVEGGVVTAKSQFLDSVGDLVRFMEAPGSAPRGKKVPLSKGASHVS